MRRYFVDRNIANLNTGTKNLSELMDLDELNTIPELSNIYKMDENVINSIMNDMLAHKYDNAEPVVAWLYNGKLTIVDGHTRYEVCKRLAEQGHDEFLLIPVVVKEFDSLEAAKEYAIHRQQDRRNLSPSQILAICDEDVPEDFGGNKNEFIAEKYNTSPATIKRAKKVKKEAEPDVIEKIENNEMDIYSAYKTVKKDKKKKAEDIQLSDALNSSDVPKPLTVHQEHPNEAIAYTTHPEDLTDRLLKEKNIQVESASKKNWAEGFEIAFYYVIAEIIKGREAKDVYNDIQDFSPDVIFKFELSEENQKIIDELNN